MDKKPRILYISAFDIPGAGNRVLVNWLKWLDKNGYGIFVACPNRGWLGEKLSAFQNKKVLDREFPIPNKKNALKSLLTVLSLCFFIMRNRIDVIHCNSDQAYYLACAAARITSQPIVTHLRFHYTEQFYSWLFGKWRKPDLILLVTEAFRREEIGKLSRTAPKTPVYVLHNCIDATEYQCINASKNKASDNIFYPAAIAERKRQHQLYGLDALLKEKGYSFSFLVAGKINELSYLKRCKEEADKYPGNGVKFLGHVDSVSSGYQESFLSVTLSVYETFGYSVLESMASGVPVVGYTVPAVAEVLEDGGILVDKDNLGQLSNAIHLLKTDQEHWERLSERGRARAEFEFSPALICPKLTGFYSELIGKKT